MKMIYFFVVLSLNTVIYGTKLPLDDNGNRSTEIKVQISKQEEQEEKEQLKTFDRRLDACIERSKLLSELLALCIVRAAECRKEAAQLRANLENGNRSGK